MKDHKVSSRFSPLICTHLEDPWSKRKKEDEVEWQWPQTTSDVGNVDTTGNFCSEILQLFGNIIHDFYKAPLTYYL